MTQLQTEQGIAKVPAGTWKVDPARSSVGFEVKHMMISTVRGHFSSFDGRLEADEDPERSQVAGWVDVASINTGSPDRDAHLRAPDFFDAERYPRMNLRLLVGMIRANRPARDGIRSVTASSPGAARSGLAIRTLSARGPASTPGPTSAQVWPVSQAGATAGGGIGAR